MKRVIANLKGGLGNQLFIYAAARRLALKENANVFLVHDSYNNEFHDRSLLITKFNIDAELIPSLEGIPTYSSGMDKLSRAMDRYLHMVSASTPCYLTERLKYPLNFMKRGTDRRFLDKAIRKDLFIDGYFQNEAYFEDVADIIRNDFMLKETPSAMTGKFASEIGNKQSVSIQFRRTDLENEDMKKKHGRLSYRYKDAPPLDYYYNAADRIVEKVGNAHFYCFSDYPDWMEKNVDLPYPHTLVTHNNSPDTCHEDLFLISKCRHHIISHSSFGWWGAWMSTYKNKIIYAPRNVCGRIKPPFYPDSWNIMDVCQQKI